MKFKISKTESKRSFRSYFRDKGLKSSWKRDVVVGLFLKADRHFIVEELYYEVRKKGLNISYSTVYRALKLLVSVGLAAERQFGDGLIRFEPLHEEEHHDHLICVKCGRIMEFENKRIEKLQEEVGRKNEFKVIRHKLELYGYCNRCME